MAAMARKDVASMFAVALFIGAFASVPTSTCWKHSPIFLFSSICLLALHAPTAGVVDERIGFELINAALKASARLAAIKVSTSIRFDELNMTFPPSDGVFTNAYMTDVARLLASTGAPLLANVYPYFAYKRDQQNISLNYATFQPGPTVRDDNNGLTYSCRFDAMVDAVYAALEKANARDVRVVVSESGWPSAGGGSAASVDNAQKYNQGLINHVGGGTPKKPGLQLETYIFAMFNEDQKSEYGHY